MSYWRLGERSGSAAVDMASGYNGAIRGRVTLGVPGALAGDSDSAMAFDGASGAINVGDTTRLDITGDLAVEAWAKAATLSELNRSCCSRARPAVAPDANTS